MSDYAGLVQVLREIKDQKKALEEREDVIKKTLAEALGDDEIGLVNGKPAFANRKSWPGRLDQKALKAGDPETFAKYVNVREARTFTLIDED
jgi:hypothetical protein